MEVIFIKDYERDNGRVIERKQFGRFTNEKAKALIAAGVCIECPDWVDDARKVERYLNYKEKKLQEEE